MPALWGRDTIPAGCGVVGKVTPPSKAKTEVAVASLWAIVLWTIMARTVSCSPIPAPPKPEMLLTIRLLNTRTRYQSAGSELAATSSPLTFLSAMPPPSDAPVKLP